MKDIKVSYIKIFVFEILAFIVLILNSFEPSILNMYKMPLFILGLNIVFYLMLGIEKDNKRYTKDVIVDLIILITFFLVLYYLSGIIITFAKTDNYTSLYGISTILIPLILTILFKEFLRNSLLVKSEGSKVLIVLTTILFIVLDISNSVSFASIESAYDLFITLALTVLPSITTNIFMTYIVIKCGYKPSMVYLLYMNLYSYLMPIVPNPSKYVSSIISLIIPVLFMIRFVKFFKNPHDEELTSRMNKKRFYDMLLPLSITIVLVYFVSGYFKYYAVAIASGSMNPVFDRGSVVILERLDKKYNNLNSLKEGNIIAYRNNGKIIVHRIIRVVDIDDVHYYYTKGDANINEDDVKIPVEEVIGKVKTFIPGIGYPTVWFSEL